MNNIIEYYGAKRSIFKTTHIFLRYVTTTTKQVSELTLVVIHDNE